MYKVFQYKKEKLHPMFNGKEYDDLNKIATDLKSWFDVRRTDQSAQLVTVDNEKIVGGVITKDMVELWTSSLALDKLLENNDSSK